MKLIPLYDRVIVKRVEEESTGMIVIPDSASEKPMQGEVIAVGSGKRLDNGDVCPVAVKVGDRILFGKYSGSETKFEDQDIVVMREDDIMAIIQ